MAKKRKITKRIDEIITHTIESEGGYVNDPDDLGGATKFGVTIHTMKRLGIDLDNDGDIDKDDVKLITIPIAKRLYADHYYFQPNIDQLPAKLQETVFDMQVLSGVNAGKCLQRLINMSNKRTGGKILTVDGAIGTNTITQCKIIFKRNPRIFIDLYGLQKVARFLHISNVRKKNQKYVYGWIKNRANPYISKPNKFDLNDIGKYVKGYKRKGN